MIRKEEEEEEKKKKTDVFEGLKHARAATSIMESKISNFFTFDASLLYVSPPNQDNYLVFSLLLVLF